MFARRRAKKKNDDRKMKMYAMERMRYFVHKKKVTFGWNKAFIYTMNEKRRQKTFAIQKLNQLRWNADAAHYFRRKLCQNLPHHVACR